jgi:hypothetical protein
MVQVDYRTRPTHRDHKIVRLSIGMYSGTSKASRSRRSSSRISIDIKNAMLLKYTCDRIVGYDLTAVLCGFGFRGRRRRTRLFTNSSTALVTVASTSLVFTKICLGRTLRPTGYRRTFTFLSTFIVFRTVLFLSLTTARRSCPRYLVPMASQYDGTFRLFPAKRIARRSSLFCREI